MNNPAFRYSFTPVNVKEINAFALPGGPMFINRGMIDSAALGRRGGRRHGARARVTCCCVTAPPTPPRRRGSRLGALAGAIAGAVVGGGLGQVISQGSQFGLGTWLLRYSREYEKQADILGVADDGARRLRPARPGARVRDHREAGRAAARPQWMSDHPNPGNRSRPTSRKEARMLQIANVRHDSGELQRAKQLMAQLPRAKSMADVGADRQSRRRRLTTATGRPVGEHRRPGAAAVLVLPHRVRGGECVPGERAVELAGAVVVDQLDQVRAAERLGRLNGQSVFTHGVEVGVARARHVI